MSTELVAIERIIIGKGEKGAEQVRKDLARYLRQFLDTASIESMSLSAMVIKLDGKTALDIHNKAGRGLMVSIPAGRARRKWRMPFRVSSKMWTLKRFCLTA